MLSFWEKTIGNRSHFKDESQNASVIILKGFRRRRRNDDRRQRFGNQRLFKTGGAKEVARKKFSRTSSSSSFDGDDVVETPKTEQSDTRAKRDLRAIERGG